MKKVISVILCVIMCLGVLPLFASAGSRSSAYPTIRIDGNGNGIYDSEGNKVYDFDVDSDKLKEMITKIVYPSFVNGLLTGDFSEYYDVFESELAALYERCVLDENGDPKYGTNIHLDDIAENERNMHSNPVQEDGTYSYPTFRFWYDWRLDPIEIAAQLNDYINSVLASTGKDKVNLKCRCMGGVEVLAYLGVYGYDKVNSASFESTTAFGTELINDTFSGKMDIDAASVNRFLNDDYLPYQFSLTGDIGTIFEFVKLTVDLAEENGLLQTTSAVFMNALYKRLYKELIPRLLMSSFGTWPGYWAMVEADNYAYTKNFIFGDTDSERYQKFSGLIAKLDNYDTLIRQRIPEILTGAKDAGVNVVIAVKYGFQTWPILESATKQSDSWVNVPCQSIGATSAEVGSTLSDSYIEERTTAGFGSYISPDKIIDASTCVLPDNTWFIKNCLHDEWGYADALFCEAANCQGEYSIKNSSFSQFMVLDEETKTLSAMTEANCHTESWYTEPDPDENAGSAFFRSFKEYFVKLKEWFRQLKVLLEKYLINT